MKLSVILIFILMASGAIIVIMAKTIKRIKEKLRRTESELKKEREWKVKAEQTMKKMVELSDEERENVKEIINSNNDDILNKLNNFLQE